MSKVLTAEKFLTLGVNKRILGYTTATPPHELLSNQIDLTDEEYNLIRVCNGDLEKAKRIIKGLEIKIKKGGKNA